MSKSGSFTLVLTVICLSVLKSLETDAQSTTDETNSCSSSSLEEVVSMVERIASVQQQIKEQQEENAKDMKKISSVQQENAKKMVKIAFNQQENANEIKSVKELLVSNSSALYKVMNVVERIVSNQERKSDEIRENLRDVKELLASNSSALQEVVNVVERIASNQEKKSDEIRENLRDVKGLQPSNDCQSAGVPRYFSEYLVRFISKLIHCVRHKYCTLVGLQ